MTDPHPMNCSTCKNPDCPAKGLADNYHCARDWILRIGCASHSQPPATDEQSIRRDEREKVLGELTGIIDGAISQLFTGTEDVVSAHARHKALAWVNMKIKELRENEEP